MVTCKGCIQHLSEYIDGTLGARYAARLHEHLRVCLACREEYETLLAAREVLQMATPPQARPDFWFHVKTVLQDQGSARAQVSTRNRSVSFFWGGLAWGTPVALLLFGLLAIFPVAIPPFNSPATSPGAEKLSMASPSANDEVNKSIGMDALISLHAHESAKQPLSDAGRLHYLDSVGEASDWQRDGALDFH